MNRFKIEWSCRRGMRELDKMIMPFYQNYFDQLSTPQQQVFVELLNYSDHELFAWLMNQSVPPTETIAEMVQLIRHQLNSH